MILKWRSPKVFPVWTSSTYQPQGWPSVHFFNEDWPCLKMARSWASCSIETWSTFSSPFLSLMNWFLSNRRTMNSSLASFLIVRSIEMFHSVPSGVPSTFGVDWLKSMSTSVSPSIATARIVEDCHFVRELWYIYLLSQPWSIVGAVSGDGLEVEIDFFAIED